MFDSSRRSAPPSSGRAIVVFALVERVLDQDFGVRAAAIEALSGYPIHDLTNALARARRAVHSSDSEVVAAAVTALVELGDVEAVGDLIGALERGDRGSEHVRKALVMLTAQDFGTSERKWRKWWLAARDRHRSPEWLIEGLGHKEDAIREAAINDLRRLTWRIFRLSLRPATQGPQRSAPSDGRVGGEKRVSAGLSHMMTNIIDRLRSYRSRRRRRPTNARRASATRARRTTPGDS